MKQTLAEQPTIQSLIMATAFRRIALVAILTAGLVVLLLVFLFQAQQLSSFRAQGLALAEAVAAPLAGGEREAVQGVLGWWAAADDLRGVAIYAQDGALVAFRSKVADFAAPAQPPLAAGEVTSLRGVRLVLPVRQLGDVVGSAYLEASWGGLYRQSGILAAGFALLTMLVLLTARLALRRSGLGLARSITDLVTVATDVARSPDHTRRAAEDGPREIADLARTFNEMLDTLQLKAATLDSELRERARTEEQLDRLAHYDSVTGLANRAHFQKELPRAAARARRQESNIALVYLDLDDFKVVNDTLGHQVGDELLKLVGERLVHVLRKGDFVCRLGGDEFTVILENIHSLRDAVEVVGKLIDRLAQSYLFGEHTLHVGVSAGIALFPEQTEDLSDLLRFADIAMYQAKGAGKNDFCIYTSDLVARANVRLAIENEMRRGIERDEFFLHYQPQVDMVSGHIVGLEALVRWRHPVRGVVSPVHFIEIAEQSGLIVPLGRQIITKACQQWAQWRDGGVEPPRLAINVSGRQLDEESFADELIATLVAAGRQMPKIELEITESLLLSDTRVSKSMLHRLAAVGIKWSLDDFGTGYSSLAYLSKFPISNIKIDRSFVARLPGEGHSNSEAIVRAVLGMAGGLDMRVVIEGVETREQAEYLIAMGGRIGQGYFFYRPMSGEEVLDLLRSKQAVADA